MASFLQELFGLAANGGVELTRIANRLSGLSLGLDDKLSHAGEKLCVATINQIENTWKEAPVSNVALELTDTSGVKVPFYIAASPQNKSIAINQDGNVSLSYALLLAYGDRGAAKQRRIIEAMLYELDYVGYKFEFDITNSDISNVINNHKVVSITAIDGDGKQVNINEILVKYGVCRYSNLGNTLAGGLNQQRMRDLANEAIREKRGPSWNEAEYIAASKVKADKLAPMQVLDIALKKNSKLVSNKPYEEEFEHEDSDEKMFKIGDVWLRIPPTHITVTQMRNSYTIPLIGMESKPLATPVNRTIVKVNVVFTGGQVYDDLVRILMQFRYCPINMLRSRDLFKRLSGSESFLQKNYSQSYYIPVTMDEYSLFSVEGHPGTVSCVFQFSLFNYQAYSPDNPRGLEYFKHDDSLAILIAAFNADPKAFDPDNNNKEVEVTSPSLKESRQRKGTTFRLEEASHPYNANVEDKLALIQKDEAGLFDMSSSEFTIWKIDMDRYFTTTRGVPEDWIDVDNEKNMKEFMDTCIYSTPLFSEIAHSISISYNNIFAYQPLLSQSQPVAQYVGPGETVVSVNLKGINLDTTSDDGVKKDQALMGSLLKSWSESYGTAEYGFFDDRYFLRSTLLNLADANIVSIQNTACTSVESKPGLFDINILFSKSMFEYNLRNNPVCSFDPYFGLTRMTKLYQNDPDFDKVADVVQEKVKASYTAITDRMKDGLSINGLSGSLRVILTDVLDSIKKTKGTYYKANFKTVDLAKESPKQFAKTRTDVSSTFTQSSTKTKRTYMFEFRGERNLAPTDFSNAKVILKNGKEGTFKISKWYNVTGNDVLKNKSGNFYVDIEGSEKDVAQIKQVSIVTSFVLDNEKVYELTNENVYDNLKIVVTSEIYNVAMGEKTELAETKAKYGAFGSLMNEISAAALKNEIVYDITPGTLTSTIDGKVQQLWENESFMKQFFVTFCVNTGRNSNSYNGVFNEKARKDFVQEMLNKRDSFPDGSSNVSSQSNHYHFATKNGTVLEFTNPLFKEVKSGKASNELASASLAARNKIDEMIKAKAGDKVHTGDWKQDKKDPAKWSKVLILKAEQKGLPDPAEESIVKNELGKSENKAILQKLENKAKLASHSKPFSAHRYYPLADGFVGWSTLLSTTMGSWFVTEDEEETIHKVYRIKETVKTAMPWNRDRKLVDPDCVNSAVLKANLPGLLDYTDATDPLGMLAAIVRPKMMKDISAARQEGQGTIADAQFIKKEGTILFGDDPTKNPESTNVVFNSFSDWLMYSDGSPEVDYIGANKKGVKAEIMSKALASNAQHISRKEEIWKDQLALLSGGQNTIDRSLNCESVESVYHYNDTTSNLMQYDASKKSCSSVLVGTQATPLGQATGKTLAEAGINEFGYSMTMNDAVVKTSTHTAMINGGHSCLATGGFVRPGVLKDKDGNTVQDDNYNAIPETFKKTMNGKSEELGADRLSNIMTSSYLEGLAPTRGTQNAFPTYKMYIIKSDTSDYKFSSLDDYWDYRLVQDIMVVRDKNIPTHMLKARVIVDPRYITISPDYKYRTGVENRLHGVEANHTGVPMGFRDTADDAKVFFKEKAPLRPGMRICIKMGYHSDPRYLDTVFIGTITQLNGSLDSGLYELAAEGDGRELRVPAVNFSEKFTGENYTDIINAILRVNPNVIHFGKVYGSFLRRLSYGHKNLAQIGMLGLSAFGALGVGVAGVAVPGGTAAYAGYKAMTFQSASRVTPWLAKAGGAGAILAGGAVALGAINTMGPIFMGEFQQAAQWANPAFDELVARRITETNFYQDLHGRTDKSLLVNMPIFGQTQIPMLGELPGILKGNIFNANKQSYQLAKHFYQTYRHGNNPIDDNIFAVDIWSKMSRRASLNITNKKSIWDVLQTVRRMYPNYALDVRPFGSRSTIFLGPIGFNYWRTDDPVQAMLPQLNMMEGLEGSANVISKAVRKGIDSHSLRRDARGDSEIDLIERAKKGNSPTDPSLGLTRAPFIPFQKHHLITSDQDIIMNGLKPTPERGWNAVIATYGDDPNNIDPKNSVEFVADTDIFPEAIIRRTIHIDFTKDPESAARYALGYLKEGVERLYGGTIIIKGNSKIEPYDKIYISDTVNKMFGWVQVEAVIHKFDQEMGYTTHIVPNMVCEINNNAYLTTQNIVMSTLYDRYYKKGEWKSLGAGMAVGAAVGLGAELIGIGASLPFMAGVFIFQALTTYSDFKNAWMNGKKLSNEMKDSKRFDQLVNAEKTMFQDIIASSIEQDTILKGIKYGWAVGYLARRAYPIFKETKGSSKGMLKGSFDGFAKRIERRLAGAADVLKTNFGSDSEVKKAWERTKKMRSIDEELKRLKRGNLTSETTSLDEKRLKEVGKEWKDTYEKYQKAVVADKMDVADGMLEKLMALEETHIKGAEHRIITEETIGLADRIKTLAKLEENPGVFSKGFKGLFGTATKGFEGASGIFSSIFRSGALAWLSFGALEFLPNLGYSFAVKAVTKNNVMLVSPVHWRESYLMPSLDGYMANDTFMHINDMLVNMNNALVDAKDAINNYLPQVFPVGSDFEALSLMEGVQSVEASLIDNLAGAGEFVRCILNNCNLEEIPKASLNSAVPMQRRMWDAIAKYIKDYAVIRGGDGSSADITVTMLSLIYNESKFIIDSVGPLRNSPAYGLGQIVTKADGGNYDNVLKKNLNLILPYVDNGVKSSVAKGKYKDLLLATYANEDNISHYVHYNIKCMAEIMQSKWNYVYDKFYKDPNGRLAKARAKSKQADIIDAILLYGAYNGLGSKFAEAMFSGGFITDDGVVVRNPPGKSSFETYSSQQAIWKKDGFLSTYIGMREAFAKCRSNIAQQERQKQIAAAAAADAARQRSQNSVFDGSAKAVKQMVADVAYGWLNKTFTTSNATKKNPQRPRDIANNVLDCSAFVGMVVDDATRKYKGGTSNPIIQGWMDITGGKGAGFSSSQVMASKGKAVELANAQPGDLVFYKKNGVVKHVEVYWGMQASIGTSDSKGTIQVHNIMDHPTYGSNYEIRSYFNY